LLSANVEAERGGSNAYPRHAFGITDVSSCDVGSHAKLMIDI
jgi:hypothetical protein